MSVLAELLTRGTPCLLQRPWPRTLVDSGVWTAVGRELAAGRLILLGLWAESATVHMALLDERDIRVVSFACPDGTFPSIAAAYPPASRLERAIRDLFSLQPRADREAPLDTRPWLDHGRWGVQAPLAATRSLPAPPERYPSYAFLPAEGESLHEIPVGPVHAGIIEPGHFRFTAAGEVIVRLEARLGYAHKGIEGLMAGAELGRAAELAARISGDSTVAYGLAFARAAEAALGIDAPQRAQWLRALLAELERLANHLGDVGAICNDAAFALMHAHCGMLREQVLRTAAQCFGHRLMRDRVVPGGITVDLEPHGRERIAALLEHVRRRFPALVELYDNTASLQNRTVATGIVTPELAARYGAGGFVGRASGRAFDARRKPGYPPYHELDFDVPVLDRGDVDARVWIRIREVEQSLAIIEQILARLPGGALRIELPRMPAGGTAEGVALVEAFRGDVLVWLKLASDTTVDRCHLRDASWFQWPLLEAAIDGDIVADFPLCNKSFNCSYSGHDL